MPQKIHVSSVYQHMCDWQQFGPASSPDPQKTFGVHAPLSAAYSPLMINILTNHRPPPPCSP